MVIEALVRQSGDGVEGDRIQPGPMQAEYPAAKSEVKR